MSEFIPGWGGVGPGWVFFHGDVLSLTLSPKDHFPNLIEGKKGKFAGIDRWTEGLFGDDYSKTKL